MNTVTKPTSSLGAIDASVEPASTRLYDEAAAYEKLYEAKFGDDSVKESAAVRKSISERHNWLGTKRSA